MIPTLHHEVLAPIISSGAYWQAAPSYYQIIYTVICSQPSGTSDGDSDDTSYRPGPESNSGDCMC